MTDVFLIVKESLGDTYRKLRAGVEGFPSGRGDDALHLERTIDWLVRASENGRGGVAGHYSLLQGAWLPPFPETTGYIIPTLFDYSTLTGDGRTAELAIRLADWLASVQLENGGCIGGLYDGERTNAEAVIFNTGQNLLGFLRAHRESGDERYLKRARMAGDLLTRSTDDQGVWDRHLLRGLRHTINSRCSWALLELERVVPDPRYGAVARANLDWVLRQQAENGWFRHGSSRRGALPNTHFIAYTCDGLIESYRICGDERYLDAAKLTADHMLRIFEDRGTLYAFWDRDWRSRGRRFRWAPGRFLCLTGNAQMSLVWMALYEIVGEARYRRAGFEMVDQVKALQDVRSARPGINGGIKGSFPIYGGYAFLKFPNWAAKFFADALMTKMRLTSGAACP